MSLRSILFSAAVVCTFAPAASAVPVDVEIYGKVAVNTFTSFPFSGTPLGSDVRLVFRVESTSGIEPRPGCRIGLNVLAASLRFSHSANGAIVLPIGVGPPYTMPVFATTAIVASIPDQDELDFGGGIDFNFGATEYQHTLHVADADNASWPSADFSLLSACGFPGSNFLGPNPDDFKHWFLEGGMLDPGLMNFTLVSIRRIALTAGDGDMNASGFANGADVQLFVDAVLSQSTDPMDVCHGDFSGNRVVDVADVPGMVQTLLTGVAPPPPPPFGACCRLDENFEYVCIETPSESSCTSLPGSEHRYSFGTHCADLDPTCGSGACCLPNGGCTQVGPPNPFEACQQLGGNYFGDGTPCSPSICPGSPGACCVNNPETGQATGECEMLSVSACNEMNGTFFGEGTDCAFNPCAGACCIVGQECEVRPAWACFDLGGTFQGEGTTCEFSPCPPANDRCDDAIVVGDGTHSFTLAGASTDGDEPPSSMGCPLGFDPDNYLSRDVWFIYVASCNGTVQVDTCGSYFLGESSDTSVAVYDDCANCPPNSDSPAMLGCNESQGTGSEVQHCLSSLNDASVRFLANAGQCYKIRIGTTTGSTFGMSVMHITCGGACCPPDGPLCILASEADCAEMGGTYSGNGTDCHNDTCP
ncbi:MAG TPA: hypothetical protein VNT79_13885 [Phycisphaerae bacterium]|nr:hypothetical protein [Phycisphaerae bacterium]